MDRLRLGAVAASLSLMLAACGQPPSDAPSDPGIGHVHGLGIDPADGAIYVAGHYGLFKVTSTETAQRVAGRIQDHMGFTVTGPRTFLASGHPPAGSGRSPHLGLIRTTDAGLTWTSVSHDGTADFHSLQPAGESLYAFDSQTGKVWRSADGGATWNQGTAKQVIDLGASAAQPYQLYATTPEGLLVSHDGGANFTAVGRTPLLSHVDVPAKGVLVGAGADGAIHTSDDGGATWVKGGRLPGQASAFTAIDGQRLLAALKDGTVLESRNGGRDFSVAFKPAT